MEEELIKNSILIVIIGTASLVTAIAGILAFVILYQKKVLKTAEEKQELENNYQKELLTAFIETQEKERHRIAEDLHDGIGAALSGIKLMLNQIKIDDPIQTEHLKDCNEAIQKTAMEVRQISHNLLPPSLDALGLGKILERTAKKFNSSNLKVSCVANVKNRIPKREELALYRIAQELLTNTTKYSKADAAIISLVEKKSTYLFNYSDNGIGYDFTNSKGLGIRNIKSRNQMIEGELIFYSSPNHKSGISIQIKKK